MSKWLTILIGVICMTALVGCASQPQQSQDPNFENFSPTTGLRGFRATGSTWSPDIGENSPFPHGFRGF